MSRGYLFYWAFGFGLCQCCMPLFYIWLSLPFAGFSYFLDLLCSTSHSNNVTIYVSTIVRYVICVKQLRYFCQLANYSTRSLCDNDSITMWGRATECRLNYVNMWGMTSIVEHAVGYLRLALCSVTCVVTNTDTSRVPKLRGRQFGWKVCWTWFVSLRLYPSVVITKDIMRIRPERPKFGMAIPVLQVRCWSLPTMLASPRRWKEW